MIKRRDEDFSTVPEDMDYDGTEDLEREIFGEMEEEDSFAPIEDVTTISETTEFFSPP